MKNLFLLLILFGLSATTYSCAQAKASQNEIFQASYNSSKALVKTQMYRFVGEVVYNNKNREKLDGNSNSISINKSKVSGYLPSLSVENKSFNISGSIENYIISFKDKKQQIYIEFNVGDATFYIAVKPNGNAFLTIKDLDETTTSYTGKLEKL